MVAGRYRAAVGDEGGHPASDVGELRSDVERRVVARVSPGLQRGLSEEEEAEGTTEEHTAEHKPQDLPLGHTVLGGPTPVTNTLANDHLLMIFVI